MLLSHLVVGPQWSWSIHSPTIKAHSLEGGVVRVNSPTIKAHSLEGGVN